MKKIISGVLAVLTFIVCTLSFVGCGNNSLGSFDRNIVLNKRYFYQSHITFEYDDTTAIDYIIFKPSNIAERYTHENYYDDSIGLIVDQHVITYKYEIVDDMLSMFRYEIKDADANNEYVNNGLCTNAVGWALVPYKDYLLDSKSGNYYLNEDFIRREFPHLV